MAESRRPIITLLTDFGTVDHFVGCVKGAILEINPDVHLIDATHDVPSHDVLAAAFTLRSYYNYFPAGTVHLVVVDPGVGTRRRPLLVATERYYFVAPDSGLLSVVFENETIHRVIHITEDHFFRKPVSKTFHGRDIFAPVAAWVTRGIDQFKFGPEITDYVSLSTPKVRQVGPKLLQGVVLYVDKFGNLVTNFTEKDIPAERFDKILIAGEEVSILQDAYAEGDPGEFFAIPGSSGFYEIALTRDSAAQALEAARGTEVGALLK
ncbi:MAG: SAM-dependent chlorinase/fluorinase [Acidobacteria bacterium]|nr:SAM-dependent chlorinase/fluorinase [Acidobacteriota bacterium]MBI3655082.1 SAM-dependent chlorinase/fluorinase [Acidobacteriota bacterium]